jgi:hypothetical protein
MVFGKATKDTEAGVMPTAQAWAEMEQFQEELVKAGIMLVGEGLFRKGPYRYGRPVCRSQGIGSRLLDLAGEIDGRGHCLGQALPDDRFRSRDSPYFLLLA